MKLIKNDYVIEGTPKEINEFLERGQKETSSKVNNNCVSNDKFILTRDATLCYLNPFNNPHNDICMSRRNFPKRLFEAPKGTILEHVGFRYNDLLGKRLKSPSPIFKDKDGVEVSIPISDLENGVIKKVGTESLSELMEKPLSEWLKMSVKKENKI
ncbi:hypothetical protein [Mammaliicoccus sciuri]|uniref:hypothetical protein n=1 Tax=Mammaliicoccus sciuri TaxID=1296 RepID=UPI00195498DD|nr:hypothetical protein [Mammaliicoccus sciuri]